MPHGGNAHAIHRPRIAISMGDPLGIGPEITVKALCDPAAAALADYRVFGCARTLHHAAALAGLEDAWSRAAVPVIDDHPDQPPFIPDASTPPGPTARGGSASLRWIDQAIAATQRPPTDANFADPNFADPNSADAIVTAPISKTSWHLAGETRFPGHTELLAVRLGRRPDDVGMLFVAPGLNVMLASIHVPLTRVRAVLSVDSITRAITLADQAMRELGVPRPRLAVAGLNPHAGEGGILGADEQELIDPAIARARAAGINAAGPFPGDTIFNAAAAPPIGKGQFDCVIAMYHDQGLIPVKLLHPHAAVNMTVGLPIVRTSPAHGTAFDIAWNRTGHPAADHRSMLNAIQVAVRAVNARRAAQA